MTAARFGVVAPGTAGCNLALKVGAGCRWPGAGHSEW